MFSVRCLLCMKLLSTELSYLLLKRLRILFDRESVVTITIGPLVFSKDYEGLGIVICLKTFVSL